jgi:hypothetical protein
MNVTTLLRTLMHLPPKQSVFIEGPHGIGKSEIVKQAAAAMSVKTGKPFGIIDIRLGQYEVGDLVGIPRTKAKMTVTHAIFDNGVLKGTPVVREDVTVHDIPLWFPTDQEACGFLFMDEFDRCTRDIQQWAMQLILDYRSNFVDVPIGYRVIAAGNKNQDVYNVLNMDPALYDRFLVIPFEPSIQEWMAHAEKIGVHDAVIKYLTKFGNDLDAPRENLDMGKRYPSRRSWTKLSDTIKYMADQGSDPLSDLDYLLLLAKGFVGSIAVNFTEFIRKEYKVYSAEEILNNFPRIEEDFKKMTLATDFTFYNKILVDHMKKKGKKLTKEQGNNLFSFVKILPREVASGFWGDFIGQCQEVATTWYNSNPLIIQYVRGLLNKKDSMGLSFKDSAN